MKINIFILCYNEEVLIRNTILHYKQYLPSANITILDNKSTDNSVNIAKSFNCKIIEWESPKYKNCIDDFEYRTLKNNCWKYLQDGWVLVIDMDEWLYITEQQLLEEQTNGTSIIKVKGIDMIGESKSIILDDIDLNKINKYKDNPWESKSLCFLRDKIIDMNYTIGAHNCNPSGDVVYSKQIYINKHMSYLGEDFLINRMLCRYERAKEMKKHNFATHYTDNISNIKNKYQSYLKNCSIYN